MFSVFSVIVCVVYMQFPDFFSCSCTKELTETSKTPVVTKSASAEQIENIGVADSPSPKVAALQKVHENRSFRLKNKQKKLGKKEVGKKNVLI